MLLRVFTATVFLFFAAALASQPLSYPRQYFRNPLDLPLELAANFGELRPNHWHMGLDIRTNQKENLPVYAAADGYISFVGIRPQSFGRHIIINHPNGLSTLYAHLNDFYPQLEKYVEDQQYQLQSWAAELNISKERFPVSKGQFIAYSGNTGGSQGPHLHFEIFETKTGKRLNPLLFGFSLRDNVAPSLVKLAMYNRNYSTYEQTPEFFSLKDTDSGYIIPKKPLLKTGFSKLSFAIQAFDRLSGSQNPNGIFAATIYLDQQPLTAFMLDSIDYIETQNINAHIDYRYRYNGGVYLQHLSALPGSKSAVYKQIAGDGVIHLPDTMAHSVKIEVADAHNNISTLQFLIQFDSSLIAEAPLAQRQLFIPNQINSAEKPDFELLLPEQCLYDTTYSYYYRTNQASAYSVSALHQVKDPSIPVHDDLIVNIKPDKTIPEEWKNKLLVQRNDRKGTSFKKAVLQNGWLQAAFGDFGNFQVVADIIPPVINELGKGDTVDLSPRSRIVFTPTDNFALKSFRVELDSQWLRFTNDKSRNWIYVFDERCSYGIHHLKAIAEDLAGNITVKEWWFKKFPYTPPPPKKKKGGKKKNLPVKKSTKRK
jgi:murein DD-endopeptidase MepM/ murein hydrolase activator NlpD